MTVLALAVLFALPCVRPQEPPATQPKVAATEIALHPMEPGDGRGLRWSPKGAKVALHADGETLVGMFPLGPADALAILVRLSRTPGAEHFDVLEIDSDRDGHLTDAERRTTKPHEQRGKWWSSFDATLAVPIRDSDPPATRPYPVSLWYVFDPAEPDAEPVLRWSRRGWHEGAAELGGVRAHVLITEMEMDGVFDQRDAWALADDADALRNADARSLEQHVWFHGVAYRAVAIDSDGTSLRIEPFDPGITEEEEAKRADVYAADRAAPRATAPVTFGTDLAVALARAKTEQRRVFVDFETTWCGPCQQMNRIVYTAQPVADALGGVVPVKLDGDVARELTKRYAVTAYPTLLLLDADGREVRRAVGYRGVAALVEFVRGEETP